MVGTMRRSAAALALIRDAGVDGSERYLALWNERSRRYHFAGGHRRAGESFRDCLTRELAEELELSETAFMAPAEPRLELRYEAVSESVRQPTEYHLAVFEVRLASADERRRVTALAGCRWLSAGEIRRGVAADQRPVSDNMRRVLDALGIP